LLHAYTMRLTKTGFTLVELLVALAIVAVLVAIILPVVSKSRDKAKDAKCLSNLRQIGMAVRLYANDNQNTIVPGFATGITPAWNQSLQQYLGFTAYYGLRCSKDWQCPRALNYRNTSGSRTSYAINQNLSRPVDVGATGMSFLALPQGRRFVLVADQPMLNNDYISQTHPGISPTYPKAEYFRHNGKINILWTDISVSPMSYEELMVDSSDINKSLWKFR